MPFRSEKQRRFMYSQHPDIAARWEDKYGSKIVKSKTKKKPPKPKNDYTKGYLHTYGK